MIEGVRAAQRLITARSRGAARLAENATVIAPGSARVALLGLPTGWARRGPYGDSTAQQPITNAEMKVRARPYR